MSGHRVNPLAYPGRVARRALMPLAVLVALAQPAGAQFVRRDAPRNPGWTIRPSAAADVWFHALAVIAADQPGPLGLYSANYAREIRDIKRQRGVYPTPLDSLAPSLRDAFDRLPEFALLHFAPLYFPRAKPEAMLEALDDVAHHRVRSPRDAGAPEVRYGALLFAQAMEGSGEARRKLGDLVGAVRKEWEIFYRDYWNERRAADSVRYAEMQEMWDSTLAPRIAPYLARRDLTGGWIMPSPALGPEGRIVDDGAADPNDQVAAVQMSLNADRPAFTVFAFLKELCFLILDANEIRTAARDSLAPPLDSLGFEDLQRKSAVRCGALMLDFYAPTLAAKYRRVFLDAVGAEESNTIGAFERVFALDPRLLEYVREEVRRRR